MLSRRSSANQEQDLRNDCLDGVVFSPQHLIIIFFVCVNPTSLVLE